MINKKAKRTNHTHTLHTEVIQESLVFLLHSNSTFQGTQQEDYNTKKSRYQTLLILIDISEHVFCTVSSLRPYVGQNV